MIIIVVSSQPLAQNLEYGCAGRVGNLTISSLHRARLLDLEPDKELSDQISLATLTCVEFPGIASSLLDNWRNAMSPSTTWFTDTLELSPVTKLNPWSIEFGSTGPKYAVE